MTTSTTYQCNFCMCPYDEPLKVVGIVLFPDKPGIKEIIPDHHINGHNCDCHLCRICIQTLRSKATGGLLNAKVEETPPDLSGNASGGETIDHDDAIPGAGDLEDGNGGDPDPGNDSDT